MKAKGLAACPSQLVKNEHLDSGGGGGGGGEAKSAGVIPTP